MTPYRKFIAVFDNHGDAQDDSAVAAMFEFLKFWKPELRIHGGDCFDFRFLRKNATEGEKRERIQEDFDTGIEFIERFKPTHFLRGNHDERLWDAAESDDGKLNSLASKLIVDIKEALGDAVMLPYDKRAGVLRLGKLKIIHGFHAGLTAARQASLVYGSVLMGHCHTIDHHTTPALERHMGRVCGCLCKLDQTYNRAQANTLRQSHGWAYGILLPSGEYCVWQAEKVAGRWFFPTEIRELSREGKN